MPQDAHMNPQFEQAVPPTRTNPDRESTSPRYRKPEVRPYGRIEPRLTFSPPGPPP